MKENKLLSGKMSTLVWSLGLPMIISMVLQALYNIVDTAFVINMDPVLGVKANLALTYAFPVQIIMIAVGVGTGVGINALLSRYLGEKDVKGNEKTVGNGIFLMVVIYLLFLLFGIFGSGPFIAMQTNDQEVIAMGKDYLTIVCTLSLGSIGFTVYERFLQSSGKTTLSMIGQVSGALTNIVLDYVFIYPLGMGIQGAAYATIIGQFVSLLVVMIAHYGFNHEVKNSWKSLIPDYPTIKAIYHIGGGAAIMQALLSVMMLGVNLILGTSQYSPTLLQGSFGIYYKVQQVPLFACFGLSNALITLVSFTKGSGNKERLKEVYRYGVIASLIVPAIIAIIYEALASQIATIFGLASGGAGEDIVRVSTYAIRIASISYIFMGFSVGMQGILQGLRYSLRPLLIAFLRLAVFVFPTIYLFTLSPKAEILIWLSFIISEGLTAIITVFVIKGPLKKSLTSR